MNGAEIGDHFPSTELIQTIKCFRRTEAGDQFFLK
jgi:hypothetical protein